MINIERDYPRSAPQVRFSVAMRRMSKNAFSWRVESSQLILGTPCGGGGSDEEVFG